MDKFLWLLVEWIGDRSSCSYDVIKSRYLINQNTDLGIEKEVFLLYDGIKNERRKAKIHKISDNIYYITELKLKLIKQQEENQINRVQNISTYTVAEMRTGSVMEHSGEDANFSDYDTDYQSSNASHSPDEPRQSALENVDEVSFCDTDIDQKIYHQPDQRILCLQNL
ncbi:unnamed protein product [Euphydryas editha]|uniref:Uncharacterized protein n=1 Tax=Euphydryas editha TaxID=104508 RepID=A0AAU9TEU8_EUPED|nr:unnamed protein product [Euphydryas editha]